MVKSQLFLTLAVGFLTLNFPLAASPVPSSSCANDIGDSGFSCNFYESLAGVPSEVSDIVAFPSGQSTTAGYIVLLESPSSSHTDPTQWSDILQFIDNGTGNATSAQLLSSGCNCFPSLTTVEAAPNLFLTETQTGTGNDFLDSTPYVSGFNTFNIFSAAPDPLTSAPEPDSLVLFASGLALSLAWFRVRVRRHKS